MSEELLSKCCPTFFKATRCDNSCFRRAEAYIATDVFASIADANREYVRFGTDDDGDDVCWYVDRTQTPLTSVPSGATIISGLTPATDIVDSEDDILIESATQDDKLWVVVSSCRRSDYDVILKGGSGPDYFVNDSTKRTAFLKRFGGLKSANGSGTCYNPKQQLFAFNSRTATIDGSTTHQGNSGVGDPDPIAVGQFITISGTTVDENGLIFPAYGGAIGNNSADAAFPTATLTNEIFRVIDIKRQNKPGVTNGVKYYKPIDAYISSPVITKLDNNCSDCLQAYLNAESQTDATTATLNTIIPFATADAADIACIDACPSLWPCRVQIDRQYDIRCTKTRSPEGGGNKQISRSPVILNGFVAPEVTSNCCTSTGDGTLGTEAPKSFEFNYNEDIGTNIPCTKSIFDAHRNDLTSGINSVTIKAEYTKNMRLVQNQLVDVATCGNTVNTKTLTDEQGNTCDFNYSLNSISITTSYDSEPTHTDVPIVQIEPTAENEVLELAVLPAWKDSQQRNCDQFNNCIDGNIGSSLFTTSYTVASKPGFAGKLEENLQTIGLDATQKIYKGRIGMLQQSGKIIPFLRYVDFYCHNNETIELPSGNAATLDVASTVAIDNTNTSGNIDLVVPYAPQIEIAAGFNVNGMSRDEQLTARVSEGGRSDAVDHPTSAGNRCYPGKSHQSKITFGLRGVNGDAIEALPFYLQSYCVGVGPYTYEEGTHKCFSGASGDDITNFENELSCTDGDEETKHSDCPKCDIPCVSGSGSCRDIFFLTNPSFAAAIASNNVITKWNGSQTGVVFKGNYLYQGNGVGYAEGGLSGDPYEYHINGVPSKDPTTTRAVGVDSEWSSIVVEAQDPWTKGCEDCLRNDTGITNSNYTVMSDGVENLDADEFNNPHGS